VIDVVLLFGKLALLGLLVLFVVATMRVGIRLVAGGAAAKGASFGNATADWCLVVQAGPPELRGVRVPIDRVVTIGRSPDADITIADSFVSGHHARVSPGAGAPVITDLDSTNGTVLNGSRIAHATNLADGDLVTLGDVVLKVERA
jgi:hypothetical protein